MKQTLHIFAKDVRRFWPEIAVSLAITAAFALIYPRQWDSPLYASAGVGFSGFVGPGSLLFLAPMLAVLVPISWWMLIARVIHGESLVGDRQFWLTRPYEWKKLIAAKILFLVIFLYLPFVLAQLALLAEGGFRPFAYMPGLFFNLMLVTGILVMPLFAIAAVTSNLARMTLAIASIVLLIIGVSVLSSHFHRNAVSTPDRDHLSIPILICLCGGAIAVQYAARRLWLSRALLAGLYFIVAGVSPAGRASVDQTYQATADQQSIQFTLLNDPTHQVTVVPLNTGNEVQITLPVQVSGVADGTMIMPDNVKVSIDATNGVHWSSSWQASTSLHYLPGSDDSSITFIMDRSAYEQMKSFPVHFHLTLALTQTQAGEVQRIAIPTTDFSVPAFGVCSPVIGFSAPPPNITGINCRSAFRQPRMTYVEVTWSNTPCTIRKLDADPGVQGAAWTGDLDDDPAQFGITSVWMPLVLLSNSTRYRGGQYRTEDQRYLCPGAQITFTRYNVVRRFQSSFTLPQLQLPTNPS